MIVGLGMDLVEIARIRRAMENPRFLERVLTPTEREFAVSPAQVAGRWAAKEAIYKALGLHSYFTAGVQALGIPLSWQDVEILPAAHGAPRATVRSPHYNAGRMRLQVTITHERTHAAAVAVVERTLVQSPIY